MNDVKGCTEALSVLSPHISIADELYRLEEAVCRIKELHDRILDQPSELADTKGVVCRSFNSVLHDTPQRLMDLSDRIGGYVADIEKTLFS